MNRTSLLVLCALLIQGLACQPTAKSTAESASQAPPNIIYLFTDQQHANMMSCAGNPWLSTPAMDYIAENGIRFTRAYTTNPVCSPARLSLLTGRFPGYFKDEQGAAVRDNRAANRLRNIPQEVLEQTLPAFLKQAGYELVYGGKEHLPAQLHPTELGFIDISDNEREELAQQVASYLRADHERPYFMVVSLINPHDICYMAIRDFAESDLDHLLLRKGTVELAALDKALEMPEGVSEAEFFAEHCPPLPPNYAPQEGEPKAIEALLGQRRFREFARAHYTDEDWRRHRWAYCRLTEQVDDEIQLILDALKASGQEETTLVMLSSDHGDMDAAHRMEHKSTLYEESANVPFLAMWKGNIPAGQVDKQHLVSSGLDLLPTVCEVAGVNGSTDPRGRSLLPLMRGEEVSWRSSLGVESEIGRMVVSEDGFKYIRYDAAGIEEQLLNLQKDPHETTHFTDDPAYADKFTELKEAFETEWFPPAQ